MPLNAESALEAFFGSARRSIVATTSSALKVSPVWYLTPLRSLKVQTELSSLCDQLSARHGFRVRSGCVTHRNSPVWISMVRPPWSAIVTGLMAPAGVTVATRIVAPGLTWARASRGFATRPKLPASPPSTGSESPSMLPCRRKVRRSILPAASSSMRSFSRSPRPPLRRSDSFGFWVIVRASLFETRPRRVPLRACRKPIISKGSASESEVYRGA